MREIEFRAWAEASQEMITGEYESDEYVLTIERGKVVLLEQSMDEYGGYSPAVADIEQYTGLKDKNGKKIFEGDKVKYSKHYIGDYCYSSGNGIIEFNNGSFFINEEELSPALCKEEISNCQIEIIGNIHEDKDNE